MIISAVILNWKRPDNVHLILDEWRARGIVDEALVWNNNARAQFTHDWATVISSTSDMGLYTRFAAVAMARHPVVWIQDDDLFVPAETIQALFQSWRSESDILHGLFGRAPRSDGSYAIKVIDDSTAPIILTRAVMAARSHAATFFNVAPKFERIQFESSPRGNGEDIIFSYAVRRQSGKLHRVHSLPYRELPAPDAIHRRAWEAHLSHRTALMRACEAWLGGASPGPD